jgi:hypothetical protein
MVAMEPGAAVAENPCYRHEDQAMGNRRDEPPRTWFRSDRFFRSDQKWYFHTREGFCVGPYRTRFEAEIDVGILLSLLRDTPSERTHAAIRDFLMGTGGDLDYINDPAFTSYVTQEGNQALRQKVS